MQKHVGKVYADGDYFFKERLRAIDQHEFIVLSKKII
jgi:hypothetical protein